MDREVSAILDELAARLRTEGCSCVIRNGGVTRIFRERGVKDLYRLLCDEPGWLRGAFVADKVVGRGAAALMILGGVRALHAEVASRGALEFFGRAGTSVRCLAETPGILNRARTGSCPVESRCAGCRTAEECLVQIEAFLQGMETT